MAKTPMTDAKVILKFMFAGNAIFTLRNVASGNHLTYKVTEMENKNPEDKRPPLYSVGLLTGPDNMTEYTYIGIIIGKKRFKTTDASKVTMDTPSCKAIAKCLEVYNTGRIHTAIELWPSTHCAKCGRLLNDDESIARGLGPDCAEQLGVSTERRPGGQVHPAQQAAILSDEKFRAMRNFRNQNDDAGDAKFLALSEEKGFTVEDWQKFSERENAEKTQTFQEKVAQKFVPRKPPVDKSKYEGVNNGFRGKSEEQVRHTPAEIEQMITDCREKNPQIYYGIKEEGMSEQQIHDFWYRRFESIPATTFQVKGRTV